MPAGSPTVTVTFNPHGPMFPISEDGNMPAIQATATVLNAPPGTTFQYQWAAKLVFVGGACPHSLNRTIAHPEIKAVTASNAFAIPFSRVRGGALTVTVATKVGTAVVTSTSKNLQVTGTRR